MKKLKINYTDGTSKEVLIKHVNISYSPNEVKGMMCHINPASDGVMINATSNVIPDIKFVKSFEFLEA